MSSRLGQMGIGRERHRLGKPAYSFFREKARDSWEQVGWNWAQSGPWKFGKGREHG